MNLLNLRDTSSNVLYICQDFWALTSIHQNQRRFFYYCINHRENEERDHYSSDCVSLHNVEVSAQSDAYECCYGSEHVFNRVGSICFECQRSISFSRPILVEQET